MYFSDSFDKINNKRDLKGFWLTAEHCDPSLQKIVIVLLLKKDM